MLDRRRRVGGPAGNCVNAAIEPAGGYIPVAVSAGTDVDSGPYDARVRRASGDPSTTLHRGNLTVVASPRRTRPPLAMKRRRCRAAVATPR